MSWTKELADFWIENYSVAMQWDYDDFCDWIQFFADQGFLILVRGNDDELLGLGVFRPVKEPPVRAGDFDPYDYDMNGDTVYVDMFISTKPGVAQVLYSSMMQNFPNGKTLAFRKLKSTDRTKLRTVDLKEFGRRLFNDKRFKEIKL